MQVLRKRGMPYVLSQPLVVPRPAPTSSDYRIATLKLI